VDPIRYFVALILVGALLGASIWALKRFRGQLGATGSRGVAIVSYTNLGTREKLAVVTFGGKTLLLGVTPGGISLPLIRSKRPPRAGMPGVRRDPP
jgi:flagellar biosynthetic protein FliO